MAVQNFYFFGSYNAFRPFIMEVESGSDNKFTIPTTGTGYNYNVKTSDGQTFVGQTGNLTITFPSANTRYDVEVNGLFPRIYFNNGSERLKIKEIKQWGDIVWGTLQNLAFYGCVDMQCSALDSPDLMLMTNGSSMFFQASVFNPPNYAPTLENLTNGYLMYYQCTAFNPPNYAPTLENLTNGYLMYYQCTAFNPPNYAPTLENLTNGGYMFFQASAFNPPNFAPTLENLTDGSSMFFQASAFNPPNFAPTLENLTNGSSMFESAINFSQDIYAPNSVNLENDSAMFYLTKIKKITLNNSSLITTNSNTFRCSYLTDLILTDRKINLWINQAPLLLSTKIDALANSVADLTSLPTATVTMTTVQYSSCDATIWTNKNWTIAIV
jgi:hypothetical protein